MAQNFLKVKEYLLLNYLFFDAGWFSKRDREEEYG